MRRAGERRDPPPGPDPVSREEALAEVGVRLRPMVEADLDTVMEIERASFPTPWPRRHFEQELREQRLARCLVLERFDRVAGYACLWVVGDELRINNIAIHPDLRRAGLGALMLSRVLERAREVGCREATLEVRPSNEAALALYLRHGFRVVGRRLGYYSDTREDAILMTVDLGPQ